MHHIISAAFALCFFLTFQNGTSAQTDDNVKWSVSAESLGQSEYFLKITGVLGEDWHIYDLTPYPDGPNCTVISIDGGEIIDGPRIVSSVTRAWDEVFGMEIGSCPSPVEIEAKIRADKGKTVTVTLEYQACKEGMCTPPAECTLVLELEQSAPLASESSSGIWMIILQAMAWGFVALLTPCVFPMIPLTVSFFLKQGAQQERKGGKWLALLFGLSIIALYTIPIAVLILISLLTGGEALTADIFNFLATHWVPNLLFFIIFMAFAASFFGAFELVLPSGLTNKFDSKSGKGGILGAFFVALTLVLVSFSCTGPIVGTVLIKSSQGEFWEPIVTMFAFALAFSLPFTVFAFAPSLLKKLPRSGSWLGSVKVVLGFIELALGFKFLSVADQTYHWGILDREVYLAIWITVFSLLGLYLLGKIRFKYETPVEHISVTRLGLSVAVFSFVVYMIPGMWGAPLKALSGYLPPITTQDFVLGDYSQQKALEKNTAKYSDFLDLPYGIPAYFDYDEALQAARAQGKPLFVDFTGHGCVNCREMEARVWSDPRVLRMLKEEYVVCALYADDKKVLPREDWVTTEDGKVLKSLGKINSRFALLKFNVNAQPYYTVLDPVTEKAKQEPRGYNLDVEAFVEFLEAGLK